MAYNGLQTSSASDRDWLTYFRISSFSHQGRVREENQDNLIVFKSKSFIFCAVCDGMGGAKGGRLASQITVDELNSALQNISDESNFEALIQRVVEATKSANDKILSYSVSHPEYHNMGTTISGILLHRTSLQIFNVGDSRVYRLREGQLELLTEDHTLVNDLLKAGLIKREDQHIHSLSHILTRSVGPVANLIVDTYCLKDGPIAGDIYLICSDGLYNMVSPSEMVSILESSEPSEACQRLVELANHNGGLDNISVVILAVDIGFPVTKADITSPQKADRIMLAPKPVVAQDDIFTPIISEYIRRIESANRPSRSVLLMTTLSVAVLMFAFLVSEFVVFDRFFPNVDERPVANLPSKADLESTSKSLRIAFLNNRLRSLYGQLELIKVSSSLKYEDVIENINRQKRFYIDQLNRSSEELKLVNTQLKEWQGKRMRFQIDDFLNVAKDLIGFDQVRTKVDEFEKASWEYLRNINNSGEVERLFKKRLQAEQELKSVVQTLIDSKIVELEKRSNVLTLESNFFKTKLVELNQQEQFFATFQGQEEASRKQLEERISNEIIALENELKSLS
ncbi:MAG: protein phosphatase 2C domain-containing protein [Deltaproteobacteria bacterium]|nr:protein phosphatase 2C domain-containing protein [Deltaproteobacteria bacterium]